MVIANNINLDQCPKKPIPQSTLGTNSAANAFVMEGEI
jgi:hypothetical protein